MRFLEVVVVLLSVVVALNLALTKARRRGTTPLLFITIIFTLLHLFLEGYRWQMVPSYALLGLFTWLRNREAQTSYALSMGLLLLLSVFLPAAAPVVKLPPPTGPFTVGTAVFHWTDSSRTEWFTDELDDLREILVQLWYPAQASDDADAASYIDHVNLRAEAIGEQVGLPAFMLKHLNLVTTHASTNASAQDGVFPLIIFSHGLGGTRTQNTVLMEELASHGYAVAAIDHPFDANMTVFPENEKNGRPKIADYRSAIPDGTADSLWLEIRNRQLNTRVADVVFTLNQLESIPTPVHERIDFGRVGIAGHSFGGATAVLTARKDHRIKAVVALDGWFVPLALEDSEARLGVPFLYMGQERWKAWNEKRHRHFLDLIIEQSGEHAFHLSVKRSRHYDYADIPLFSPLFPMLGLTGYPDGRQMVQTVNGTTLQFFDHYLKQNTTEPFAVPTSPQITLRGGETTSP